MTTTKTQKEIGDAAMALLAGIEDGSIETQDHAPVASKDVALRIAEALFYGFISVRRMARALDTTIEDIDATFEAHGVAYRTGH